MRMPDREALTSKVKVQSPLVSGSIDSNDSDPIDISRSSGSASSYSTLEPSSFSSPIHSFHRSSSHRSLAGSYASGYGRRTSMSRTVGSFVGSYEESILNGRMSQTPSKPLDFTASIGVLGKGDCKTSLRCPPHLTLPFPAYFYSETSPYVGQIDVEQTEEEKSTHKRGYRIPAEGQLQIIIKNPNKTAVKLFLVPYDVRDMPASSKTFFRQKHYDVVDGDRLKYAIHVQICCPSEGKYYIHKSQRVVFANRVPDGKESLRVIVQGPTPKYTPWVPEKRQKKADRHLRPDSREPKFIGGSLLDRDHEVSEEQGEGNYNYADGPPRDGQLTPRPGQTQNSPLFQKRKTSYLRSFDTASADSRATAGGGKPSDRDETETLTVGRNSSGEGILAERLRALALVRQTGTT